MKRRLRAFGGVVFLVSVVVGWLGARELVRLSIWYRDREYVREIPWPVRK